MEATESVVDSELPKLKRLAGELLAGDTAELALLDQIASVAAGIAARCRDEARQHLMEQVAEGAQAILPRAIDDLRSRLAQSSLEELAILAGVLDKAGSVCAAFERADSNLMAARERGDYAAIAPLALEAENQENALATAIVEFANRIGFRHAEQRAQAAAAPPEPTADPSSHGFPEGGLPIGHRAERHDVDSSEKSSQ
jgi:hypothetical protein